MCLLYPLWNITWVIRFLTKHIQNVVEKLVSDCFLKNQNWAYLWMNSLKYIKFVFIVYPSQGLPKYINTKVLTTCFYFIYSFFKKQKWSLRLVSLPKLLHEFLKNFVAYLSLLGNICIVFVCCLGCEIINFEIKLSFLIMPLFYITKKSGQTCKYLKNMFSRLSQAQ